LTTVAGFVGVLVVYLLVVPKTFLGVLSFFEALLLSPFFGSTLPGSYFLGA